MGYLGAQHLFNLLGDHPLDPHGCFYFGTDGGGYGAIHRYSDVLDSSCLILI
jgi:hypothetical protein